MADNISKVLDALAPDASQTKFPYPSSSPALAVPALMFLKGQSSTAMSCRASGYCKSLRAYLDGKCAKETTSRARL